ncbi:hypothetical protein [Weissella bombi]|uniref:hypothetical protein n=1 Tax=Weissella bombi TaxID=1505725 RepID=UPI003AF21AC4
MADYCIGSTGVAQLHISFAKPENLVTLDSRGVPDHVTHSRLDEYGEFEKRFKFLISNKKIIPNSEKNMVMKNISKAMHIGQWVLEKRYLERFCKNNGVTIADYHEDKHVKYTRNYQLFTKLRSQYPVIPEEGVMKVLKTISKQIGISATSLLSQNYEYKWRREHEAD